MYEIHLSSAAVQDYKKIPESEIEKINRTIDLLETNPRPAGYKKLQNRNAYRVRSGNYRIIYEIKDRELIILVIRVRHRSDVYKNIP
jgi:mRNA interferase RelE/StbE